MSFNNPFSGASIESREFDQKFSNLRSSSPTRELYGNNFFQNETNYNLGRTHVADLNECIDSFFDKAPAQNNLNFFNDHDAADKLFWEKDEGMVDQFNLNGAKKIHRLGMPVKEKGSIKSEKESDTACYTKDVAHCGFKRPADEVNINTRHNTSSFEKKKFFHEEISVFDDILIDEKVELPPINNVVSMSIRDDSGELSVCTNSKSINDNKVLKNFLTVADSSDLIDLLQSVRDLQTEVNSKISELSQLSSKSLGGLSH
eukprot:CAMPEP_0197003552 /NCGR_PEP_ID=MMETSP1380-20130617/8400_1 /TAXON_ID=5936 /ORGANISM="Euplotes crassus, Strain CT5" /LENGTH=258 /DNA_ID=CAMNT_0042422087 /DNA_START=1 /DNA_END=777 /DNA_ORIENTATION=+